MAMVYDIQNLEDFRRAIKCSVNQPNILSQDLMYKVITDFLNKTGLIIESIDILKEELMCGVCHEIPLEPCLTQCHHIFCAYCLDMCVLLDKTLCPMCRTLLSDFDPKSSYLINAIVLAVMKQHDSKYDSWVKQEELQRFCSFCTKHLQSSYDSIVESLETFKLFNNDEKLVEEVSNLLQEYLSLLKQLPCSEADLGSFQEKRKELIASTNRILEPLVSLGYLQKI